MGKSKLDSRLQSQINKHNAGMSFKLRAKALAGGGFSLYLDFRKGNEKNYETLGYRLLPNNAENLQHNKEVLRQVFAIQTQREKDYQSSGYNLVNTSKSKITLLSYIARLASNYRKIGQESMAETMEWLGKYVEVFDKSATMGRIDKVWVLNFIQFTKESNNLRGKPTTPATQKKLYDFLNIALSSAFREEIILVNPTLKIDKCMIPKHCNKKEKFFLTIPEVELLARVPVEDVMNFEGSALPKEIYENVQRAFLFSCFTGLRVSDIKGLKWDNIHTRTNGAGEECQYIEIQQKKTKKVVCNKLNSTAIAILEKQDKAEEYVFILPNEMAYNRFIRKWAEKAGIDKHISFHCARHTAGTMFLNISNSLDATAKFLGHSSTQPTQIYAKMLTETMDGFVDSLPTIK